MLHRVGDKKSAQLQYGCKYCGLFFSTEEHLTLHSTQSSCGKKRSGFVIPDDECLVCSAPTVVDGVQHETLFPKHVSSTSKRLNIQHICPKCGLYFISDEIVAEHSKNSFCTRFEAQKEKDRARDGLEYPQHKRLRLSREDSYESSRTSPLSTPTDGQASARRPKRVKQLVPAGCILLFLHNFFLERKAFYSICSLFVDKTKVANQPENFLISPDNVLSLIEDDKLPIVKRLMEFVYSALHV